MLGHLPSAVAGPRFDPAQLTAGIVHIGVGNFHRAHQAWYLHQLMQQGQARDWAIIGAGTRPYDAQMRKKLLAQDCLTTLLALEPAGISAQVIGSMVGYLPIEPAHGALIRAMAQPSVRIVSLTITEGGYYLDASSGAVDLDHKDIQHDARHPSTPRTAFGAMVAALGLRRQRRLPPFSALSCDNLQGNGTILRQCLVELAHLSDPALARWIASEGAFPNSMVDCIVPATNAETIQRARCLGIDDTAPVAHENFRQWVIEERFCAGRPPWEDVGVLMGKDVHAYESMKIRILNGGHQLLANAGEILALATVADCMNDAGIAAFFHKVQREEILPHVVRVPTMTQDDYLALVCQRFANPALRDSTLRVVCDGMARHTGFILPSLRDALARGASVRGLALAEALWARMCFGVREDGSAIAPSDPHWAGLQDVARSARLRPSAWLEQANIYGALGGHPAFGDAFCSWLERLWQRGCRATLQHFVRSGD